MPRPFADQEFTFTNPDGTAFRVRGWGNQFHAVFETLDGFTVVKDPESGCYRYARLSDDGTELVPTSGDPASDLDPRSLGLEPHLRLPTGVAKAEARVRAVAGPSRRWEIRRRQRKQPEAGPRAAAPYPPPGDTVGTYVGLCLLIEFPDVRHTIARVEVDHFCNQVGYTGFHNNGSVRDYFHEVSAGRLTYTNTVTEYHTAKHRRAYYTDSKIEFGTRARELIVEALDHLVATGFDFKALSSDRDGFIYALNVFYAESTVNNWSEGLWPHSSALAEPYNVGGGKKFNDYQISDMGSELSLGTFCHENGHMVCDFPDLYDYGYESVGAGNYSLMAYGGSEKNPVHVDAYLKYEAGWTTKVMKLKQGINVKIEAGKNEVCVFTRSDTEFFVIENRQRAGRDADLPDSGLAIWHVDTLGDNSNEQMTEALHYECALEQADGRFDLEHYANVGDETDLFGAPAAARFGDDTNPSSRWWNGAASGLTIDNISRSGATMTFKTRRPYQHVVYLTGDGHVHEMYFRIGGRKWSHGDLTATLGAPPAAAGSALTSWTDAHYQHVVYLTVDGRVHEMYFPIGGRKWSHGDLTSALGAPPAASRSPLTSWTDPRYEHIVYLTAEGHVHEMYFPIGGHKWSHGDLTAKIGAPPAASRSPLTSWTDPRYQHVVYLTADGHLQEMYLRLGGRKWSHGDLTATIGAPAAASGSTLTSWADPRFQHVVYLTADGHLHEMYLRLGGRKWSHGDLTANIGAPPAASGSALTSWADPRFQHVVYLSPDEHVHELYFPVGGQEWSHGDLTATIGAPAAASGSALSSWTDPRFQHVVYLSPDAHVHEMFFPIGGRKWSHGDLTAGGAPAAAQGSDLTSWADRSTAESTNCGIAEVAGPHVPGARSDIVIPSRTAAALRRPQQPPRVPGAPLDQRKEFIMKVTLSSDRSSSCSHSSRLGSQLHPQHGPSSRCSEGSRASRSKCPRRASRPVSALPPRSRGVRMTSARSRNTSTTAVSR